MSWFEELKKKQNHIYSITPVSETELQTNTIVRILEFDLSKVIDNNDLLKKIYAYKEDYPVSMQSYSEHSNVKTWHSNWKTHLISAEFNPLIEQITNCLNNNIANHTFQLDDFWINVYDEKGWANRHMHSPYMVSIVYFVKSSIGSESLIIDNNVIGDQKKEVFIKPTPGKLVVFPGSVYHRVETNSNETDTRISIAANFVPNCSSANFSTSMIEQGISISKFGKPVDN